MATGRPSENFDSLHHLNSSVTSTELGGWTLEVATISTLMEPMRILSQRMESKLTKIHYSAGSPDVVSSYKAWCIPPKNEAYDSLSCEFGKLADSATVNLFELISWFIEGRY